MKLSALTLGMTVRGMISGLEGIASHMSESMSGEPQVQVSPQAKDNDVKKGYFIDVTLVEFVDDGISRMAKVAPVLPFNLGDRLRDKVSGFTGIFTEKNTYINGCVFCVLRGRYTEASHKHEIPTHVFSWQELEKVDDGLNKTSIVEPKETPRRGGPDKPGMSCA